MDEIKAKMAAVADAAKAAREMKKEEIAFAAAIEADLTLLEAAEAAADNVEKYGESAIEEVPEAE